MLPKANNKELLRAETLRAEQWGKSEKPVAVKRDKPRLSAATRTQNLLEELALKRNDCDIG